jgi:hypothetical protein
MEEVQMNWSKWEPAIFSAFALLLSTLSKSKDISPDERDTLADAALERLRERDEQLHRKTKR